MAQGTGAIALRSHPLVAYTGGMARHDADSSGISRRPRWRAELSTLASLADDACGLDVRSLQIGQTILVRTAYSTYRLKVSHPGRCKATVVGTGSFLQDPTEVTIVGATLSGRGSSVAHGRVLTGYRLVLAAPEGEIITSRVDAISVDGMPWFSDFRRQ